MFRTRTVTNGMTAEPIAVQLFVCYVVVDIIDAGMASEADSIFSSGVKTLESRSESARYLLLLRVTRFSFV